MEDLRFGKTLETDQDTTCANFPIPFLVQTILRVYFCCHFHPHNSFNEHSFTSFCRIRFQFYLSDWYWGDKFRRCSGYLLQLNGTGTANFESSFQFSYELYRRVIETRKSGVGTSLIGIRLQFIIDSWKHHLRKIFSFNSVLLKKTAVFYSGLVERLKSLWLYPFPTLICSSWQFW